MMLVSDKQIEKYNSSKFLKKFTYNLNYVLITIIIVDKLIKLNAKKFNVPNDEQIIYFQSVFSAKHTVVN